MEQLTPLKFENRLSTGTLFIHAEINDGGKRGAHQYGKKSVRV